MDEVKNLLKERIEKVSADLKDTEAGGEEHKALYDELVKLTAQYNEMVKIDYDYWDKQDTREKDLEIKREQLAEEKKDHRVKNVLSGITIGSGIGLTIWGTLKSMKFEETGHIMTNFAGKEFMKKLFHLK